MLHSALGEILSQLYLVHPQSAIRAELVARRSEVPPATILEPHVSPTRFSPFTYHSLFLK